VKAQAPAPAATGTQTASQVESSCRSKQLERQRSERQSQSLGPRDDLYQLLGDLRLAAAVVEQRQRADHVTGVASRVLHRAHARGMLSGEALEQRPVDLHRHRLWHQFLEHRLGARLVLVVDLRLARLRLFRLGLERQQLRRDWHLADGRAELVEHITRRALRFIQDNSSDEVTVSTVGRKAADFLRGRGVVARKDNAGTWAKLNWATAEAIAKELAKRFLDGEVDAVYLMCWR
jgi:hypothetical protein